MKATVASTRESLTRELEACHEVAQVSSHIGSAFDNSLMQDKSKLQMELSEARSDLAKAYHAGAR